MQQEGSSVRKGARLFGHPVHPIITDFPIALWSISLLGDVAEAWRGNPVYGQFAFWAIAVGLIFALPTITTGLIDYAAMPQGHPALKVAARHMWIMLSAATTYACSSIFRIGHPPSGLSIAIAIGLSVLGLCLLLAGGWLEVRWSSARGSARTVSLTMRQRAPKSEPAVSDASHAAEAHQPLLALFCDFSFGEQHTRRADAQIS